jgi:MFS family permease
VIKPRHVDADQLCVGKAFPLSYVRLAVPAGGAFVCALALDLLTKVYAVERFHVYGAVAYNDRPHDLAVRIDVSLVTIAAVYLIERAGRRRGLGRLWGAWIFVGVLIGGTLGNGVSSYLWARGVPDFIHLSDGWVWNIADFEIVVGLLGAAVSVVVNGVVAYVRSRRVTQR